MPESLVFSHAKSLVSLLFGALRSIPTHYLNFKFLFILVQYSGYILPRIHLDVSLAEVEAFVHLYI